MLPVTLRTVSVVSALSDSVPPPWKLRTGRLPPPMLRTWPAAASRSTVASPLHSVPTLPLTVQLESASCTEPFTPVRPPAARSPFTAAGAETAMLTSPFMEPEV